MQWNDLGHFFEMGGYGFYVWGSYLMCAAVVIGEVLALRARRRRALAAVRNGMPTMRRPA
jgi:heme exporter protein D